ncbi:MAG: hypothetical protein A3C90_01760 [Candidatus Magasanikbacteria bacterium RIFCSPHIGHO2_02_FULL_51_14]|uniref:NYN domain-containing protein n=1 Tax=Candidatus Magasanikbacteria bacterium RIFCSPHIGHO2_02_FULL_51_14 TaxID=1798683 RepID=A0A1F6MG55_9BACT|nr:MAG: hypothetical protein A3C90_01760 [Candidatus Magasanikbacteria bacterium RIFCSPHIGHO2_02_FULL_51_14]
MREKANNYAFIDSQNVNLAIRGQGWILDWKRFRVYLREKYQVGRAYLFLGYLKEQEKMYDVLQSHGFDLIFKPVIRHGRNSVKANVDAELVLQAMIDFDIYTRAVIVTGDGDFYCLVHYLKQQSKLERLIIPNRYQYSVLLRDTVPLSFVTFMNDLEERLEYKNSARKRSPVGGST